MLPSLSAVRYSARYDQRRASPQKPAGELWLGKICQQDTVGGGTRVGDMSMRESTLVAGCCCNSSSSGSSSSRSSSGTGGCCRISMWLLCRRRWSRRASAGPPSGSLLRVVGQIGSATNRRRRLMPRTGSPRMCQHEVQVSDISLPAIVVGCE